MALVFEELHGFFVPGEVFVHFGDTVLVLLLLFHHLLLLLDFLNLLELLLPLSTSLNNIILSQNLL